MTHGSGALGFAELAPLIEEFGPPERLLAKSTSCFRSLAKSILYQQLAGTAAAAIYSRFLAVCGVSTSCTIGAEMWLAACTQRFTPQTCGQNEEWLCSSSL